MSHSVSESCRVSRVLFADDDPAIRRAFQRTVVGAGFQVDLAEDGDAALEQAHKQSYSIIAVDHQMPGLCGTELVRQLKELQPHATLLMITGHSDLAMESCRSGSVFAVFSKPWDDQALLSILSASESRLKASGRIAG